MANKSSGVFLRGWLGLQLDPVLGGEIVERVGRTAGLDQVRHEERVVHGVQAQAQTAKGHAKKAGKNIKAAATEVSKTANAKLAKQQKPKHRGLLIFGIIAAAVAAGVAAWKASRPVEDPWKVPTPVTPAPAAPASETTLKETADKAGSAAVAAADSAAEASKEASGSVAAATDKATEAAKDAADNAADAAAKVATDAKTAVRNIAASLNNGADKPGK